MVCFKMIDGLFVTKDHVPRKEWEKRAGGGGGGGSFGPHGAAADCSNWAARGSHISCRCLQPCAFWAQEFIVQRVRADADQPPNDGGCR